MFKWINFVVALLGGGRIVADNDPDRGGGWTIGAMHSTRVVADNEPDRGGWSVQ